MSKHTPGPWVDGNVSDAIVVKEPFQEGGLGPSDEMAKKYYGGLVICESVAPQNKAIIKAAPDLYESLAEMVEMVEGMDCGDEPGFANPWHVKATAALRKARGETDE